MGFSVACVGPSRVIYGKFSMHSMHGTMMLSGMRNVSETRCKVHFGDGTYDDIMVTSWLFSLIFLKFACLMVVTVAVCLFVCDAI